MEKALHLAARLVRSALGLLLSAAFPAIALAAPGPTSLRQRVAEAIVRDLNLGSASAVVEAHLDVLTPFASLPEAVSLHVVSAKPGFSKTWLLQLACQSQRDCLPFHAVLHPLPSEWLAPDRVSPAPRLLRTSASATRPTTAVVHRGDTVTLVEEFSGMRLRAPAVCLEAGGLGDKVRVQVRATKRALPATVLGEHEVRVER